MSLPHCITCVRLRSPWRRADSASTGATTQASIVALCKRALGGKPDADADAGDGDDARPASGRRAAVGGAVRSGGPVLLSLTAKPLFLRHAARPYNAKTEHRTAVPCCGRCACAVCVRKISTRMPATHRPRTAPAVGARGRRRGCGGHAGRPGLHRRRRRLPPHRCARRAVTGQRWPCSADQRFQSELQRSGASSSVLASTVLSAAHFSFTKGVCLHFI